MLKSDGLQAGIHSHAICGCIVLAVASVVALMAALAAIGDDDYVEEVYADDEWHNVGTNLKWKYDSGKKTLFIQTVDPTQESRMPDYNYYDPHTPPWYKSRGECKKICLSDDITYIGDFAFYDWGETICLYVGYEDTPAPSGGIEFPSRLKEIADAVFWKCYKLSGVLTFPAALEKIGQHAFDQCYGITGTLLIPSTITSIGKSAFASSRFSGDIIIEDGMTSIPQNIFQNSDCSGMVVLPRSVESIEDYAFDGCDATSLDIRGTLESIGKNAFSDCSDLAAELDFRSMKSIGDYAFANCGKITGELVLSSSLTYLGEGAFQNCVGVKSSQTTLYTSELTEVKNNTFKNCTGLTGTLTIHSNITGIGNSAFEGCTGITLLKMENTGVENLVIGDYAFSNCSNMRIEGDAGLKITNAEYIGSYAFYNCPGLAGPLEITTKGYGGDGYTFAGCTGFTSAKLGTQPIEYDIAKCTFPKYAFNNCTGLRELVVKGGDNTSIKISEYAFAGCTGITAALTLHGSISSISFNAFTGCTNILTIKFDYAILDGIATDAFPSHVFYKGGSPIPISEADYTAIYSGPDSWHLSAVPDETPVSYPLFDIDGGSEPAPIMGQMARGVDFTLPGYSGQKENMRFSGWSYNDTVYQPGDELTMRGNDMPFKAVWTELVRHEVNYDLDGGSGSVLQQHGYEGDTIYLQPYYGTKETFTFLGWLYNGLLYQPADSITMPDSDITVVAYWSSLPTHTVSYDIDGGSEAAPPPREMINGTAFPLPKYEGVKAGYVFTGWLYGGTVHDMGDTLVMGDRDMAIIARWTPVHSVFYDIDGGTGDVPDTEVVQEGEIFAVAECTAYKEGFRFHGWYDGSETFQPGDGIEMGISDITLTAVWRKGGPMHSVFYDANGGSEDVPIQDDVEEGHAFIIEMYGGSKEGYTFGGWSYDGRVYYTGDRVVMGTSDIILTAVWNGRGIALDGDAITIICAAAAGIAAACAIAFYIVRIHR